MTQARLCPACRKTRLSRYNPDPLCAPCTRASRTAPTLTQREAPTWLWDSPPMRDALARVDLAAAVAVFRAAAGLTQHDLADITGWSQSSLSLFESGRRDTLYDIRALFRFADAVDMPREALLPLVLGHADAALPDAWLAEASMAADGMVEEVGVEVDRRGFGGVMVGALAAATLPEITMPTRVTASHVRYLQTCANNLYRRDQAVGGGALLRQALRQWQRARRMLDESDYSETVGEALITATGNLAACAGWLAFDAGNAQLARRLYGEALMGGGSGDRGLRTQALAQLSMLASYAARTGPSRGPAREGTRLACQAAEEARHDLPPRFHTLIALRHAYASSLLGDGAGFRSAITRARREYDRGALSEDPAWLRFIDEAEITASEAGGYRNLGKPARGEQLYRQVLDGTLAPRDRVNHKAALTVSLLEQGARSDAIAEGMTVLPAFEDGVTSIRTLNALRPVRVAAEQAKAEEFCSRFDAVERSLAV